MGGAWSDLFLLIVEDKFCIVYYCVRPPPRLVAVQRTELDSLQSWIPCRAGRFCGVIILYNSHPAEPVLVVRLDESFLRKEKRKIGKEAQKMKLLGVKGLTET